MADKKQLFREYFKRFFSGRYDRQKNDLSEAVLKKLRPELSEDEAALIQKFKTLTQQVYDLLSEDEKRDGTPEDKAVLDSYGQIADRGEIPVEARRAMYTLILDTSDKYALGYTDYLSVLQKKISLLQKTDITDLQLAYSQIHCHSSGVDPNFVHSLRKEVYKKNPENSLIPPYEAAALAAEVKKDKREQNHAFYQKIVADIDSRLAGSLPQEEQAELLEKKYKIIGKTGIGRLKAARQKINIAGELQFLFNSMDNYRKEEYYSREIEIQQEQISLINRHIQKNRQR